MRGHISMPSYWSTYRGGGRMTVVIEELHPSLTRSAARNGFKHKE